MKQHIFFKDINWDTLARQKVISSYIYSSFKMIFGISVIVKSIHIYWLQAMFIPSTDVHDTSYFMSRYIWNPEDEHVNGASDFDEMTETCSSGSCSNIQDEDVCILLHMISFCLFSFFPVSMHIELLKARP